MASNILNPIYPQPAYFGNSLITSQALTVTAGAATAVGFSGTYACQLVTFDIAGDDIRVFWEGTTPTSSTGHTLPGGTAYTWAANQYNNSKFILSGSGTTAIVTASGFNGG